MIPQPMRTLLVSGLAALALSGCSGIAAPILEPASGCVDLTRDLPCAKTTDYVTPGAQHCLIHIGQRHLVFGFEHLEKEDLREEMGRINQNQQAIYNITTEMARRGHDAIYLEGFAIENDIRSKRREMETYHLRMQAFLDGMDLYVRHETGINLEAPLNDLVMHLNSHPSEVRESFRYIPGGALLAAIEGRVRYFPAERLILYDDAHGEMYESGGLSFDPETIMIVAERREDFLLEHLADNGVPIAAVVFGAGHAWGGPESENVGNEAGYARYSVKDNVSEWNTEHPERKFSLVEVTPLACQ